MDNYITNIFNVPVLIRCEYKGSKDSNYFSLKNKMYDCDIDLGIQKKTNKNTIDNYCRLQLCFDYSFPHETNFV